MPVTVEAGWHWLGCILYPAASLKPQEEQSNKLTTRFKPHIMERF
jgi:hypothetical protein